MNQREQIGGAVVNVRALSSAFMARWRELATESLDHMDFDKIHAYLQSADSCVLAALKCLRDKDEAKP